VNRLPLHAHLRGWPLRLSALLSVLLLATTVWLVGPGPAQATQDHPVADWLQGQAKPLETTDPAAPLADLRPLRRMVGDAVIVGLGESTHGSHEQFTLKHRIVRLLVEQLGFRSFAMEEDWATGIELNRYVLTGQGDPTELVKAMGAPWSTREIQAVLEWLRDWNTRHPDKVQFVGTDVFDTRPSVYDAVSRYVQQAAPQRLAELEQHFQVIRPTRSDWVAFFLTQVPDQQPYVDHARQAYQLVQAIPHPPGDRAHQLALQHARQIVAFYEYYTLGDPDYRDREIAHNLAWWRRYTADKVMYWAANVHTANAPRLTATLPPDVLEFKAAGAYLRERYGSRYRSIGMTFDHGAVNSGWGAPPFTISPFQVPPPPPGFAERPLGHVDLPQYLLDLRTPAPPAVRSWLHAPAKIRVTGATYDPSDHAAHYMTGGSLAEWFDLIVHRQVVTPSRLTL
jgi:erythromycin esterase